MKRREKTDAPEPLSAEEKKKKRRRILLRVLAVLLAILLLLGGTALYLLHLWRSGRWQPSEELVGTIKEAVDGTELMQYARSVKADLKTLAEAIRNQDVERAVPARAQLQQDVKATREYLDSPLWKTATLTPGLGQELKTAGELMNLLEEADEAMIGPYLELMQRCPLSELSTEGGIRVDMLIAYLDFLEELLPQAKDWFQRFHALDLSLLDENGSIAEYTGKMEALMTVGEEVEACLPAIRAMLGGGEDRLYVFAAQNSSEIRASGGFPGSIGVIRIRDGLLTISDFQSVYHVFAMHTAPELSMSLVEERIFSGRLGLSWDADFSPDFERVAPIWARAYADRNGEAVDGVVSATPAIIQRLLSFLGSVTLSDGTELNGDNACRVLGHDLYFKYLGVDRAAGATETVDELFAESARETMHLLMSSLSVRHFKDYFLFFRESFDDRTLMVWLADAEEQALIREAGWNAGLNRDPMAPEVGIFFNSTSASKMAWFLDIEPKLSEPVELEDGSLQYTLSVRFVNRMSEEERQLAGQYILGNYNGIMGSLYLFAPAGGSIGDMTADNERSVLSENYRGLDLGYVTDVLIQTGRPVTLRCTITTAPGAEPLKITVTPTMQAFR